MAFLDFLKNKGGALASEKKKLDWGRMKELLLGAECGDDAKVTPRMIKLWVVYGLSIVMGLIAALVSGMYCGGIIKSYDREVYQAVSAAVQPPGEMWLMLQLIFAGFMCLLISLAAIAALSLILHAVMIEKDDEDAKDILGVQAAFAGAAYIIPCALMMFL